MSNSVDMKSTEYHAAEFIAEREEQRLTSSPVDMVALLDSLNKEKHLACCLEALSLCILEDMQKENESYRLMELLCMDVSSLAENLQEICDDLDDLRNGSGGRFAL